MSNSPKNPYVVGGAISDPSGRGFYGREDVFAFLKEALNAEQRTAILLCGQRRIGKTSILHQFRYTLHIEQANSVCVYFDLQGKAAMELDAVLHGLGREIAG